MKLLHSGKIRDLYADGGDLILVASDKVSVYDVVLPTPIPGKGKILTQLSLWWFGQLADVVPNHVISGHRRASRVGRAGHPLPPPRHAPRRVHRPRLSGRPGPGLLPRGRHGLGHPAAAWARRGLPAPGADLHADHQGHCRPRRVPDLRRGRRPDRRRHGRRAPADHARGVPPRRRPRRRARRHHRRHQAGVRPGARWRRSSWPTSC